MQGEEAVEEQGEGTIQVLQRQRKGLQNRASKPTKDSREDKYEALMTLELENAKIKNKNLLLEQEKLQLEIALLKKQVQTPQSPPN